MTHDRIQIPQRQLNLRAGLSIRGQFHGVLFDRWMQLVEFLLATRDSSPSEMRIRLILTYFEMVIVTIGEW